MIRLVALAMCLAFASGVQAACPLPQNGAEIAADVLQRTNTFRKSRGRTAVARSAALDSAAQAQACFMAETGQMSHTGADGSSVGDRASEAGYRWGFIAENVAVGHASAKSVFQGWRNSSGHRENMLSREARQIGIGLARANGRLYWAMVLGKPL